MSPKPSVYLLTLQENTYNIKFNIFKCHSVTLNTFTMLCKNHHCPFRNFFIISNRNSATIKLLTLHCAPPSPGHLCSATVCIAYSRCLIQVGSHHTCPLCTCSFSEFYVSSSKHSIGANPT